MKVHYHRRLLTHVLGKMDDDSTALEIAKSINVLHACEWIAAAVQSISFTLMVYCTGKGSLTSNVECDACNLGKSSLTDTKNSFMECGYISRWVSVSYIFRRCYIFGYEVPQKCSHLQNWLHFLVRFFWLHFLAWLHFWL